MATPDAIPAPAPAPRNLGGVLLVLWAVGGVLLLCGQAVWRLTPLAAEPVLAGMMNPLHWTLYLGWIVFNGYAEGYRGFQKGFSPRVVHRAFSLAAEPTLLRAVLAPAYVMSLFGDSRVRMTVSWCLVIGITGLVLLIRMLEQPWRGIIDAGVVFGLGWGVAVTGWMLLSKLIGGKPAPYPPPRRRRRLATSP